MAHSSADCHGAEVMRDTVQGNIKKCAGPEMRSPHLVFGPFLAYLQTFTVYAASPSSTRPLLAVRLAGSVSMTPASDTNESGIGLEVVEFPDN